MTEQRLSREQVQQLVRILESGWGACYYESDYAVWARAHKEDIDKAMATALSLFEELDRAKAETPYMALYEAAKAERDAYRKLVEEIVEDPPIHATWKVCDLCGGLKDYDWPSHKEDCWVVRAQTALNTPVEQEVSDAR